MGKNKLFFLSQSGKEVGEVIQGEEAKSFYEEFLEKSSTALRLYIHDSGPIPEDEEGANLAILPFNTVTTWAMKDWTSVLTNIEDKEPIVVIWIARGGFQLLDLLDDRLDNYIWTYWKPNIFPRSHEDEKVFEEFTDQAFEDKIAEFADSSVTLLFIEDIIDTEENMEIVVEKTLEICEELNIEVKEMITFALLSRLRDPVGMPAYGVLVDFGGDIGSSWGNDLEDQMDLHDFSEEKETVDDH